jgi:hypothetical protein
MLVDKSLRGALQWQARRWLGRAGRAFRSARAADAERSQLPVAGTDQQLGSILEPVNSTRIPRQISLLSLN